MEKTDSRNVPDLIPLTVIEEQPRARDLDIAERLGMARPRKIRDLIERNKAELESFGSLAPRWGKSRGQEFTEFHLNEEQALLIATLSDAPKAAEVRSMLIRTFVAYRRGQLAPAVNYGKIGNQIAAITEKQIKLLLPAMVEAALASDPRRAVLDFVSVRQMLDEAKAIQKGRNRVNRKIGHEIKDRAAASATMGRRECPHSGVWLYPRELAKTYMLERGNTLVREHNDAVSGQGILKLVRRPKPEDGAAPPL